MTGITMPGDPVAIPVPPHLPLTLGYHGDARYVSFCWSPYGDELTYSDGVSSRSAQWQAYLAFKRHRAIAPHLADYDLGSSEEDAVHMLLIDTQEQRASVAPVDETREFLQAQWPEPEPLTPEQVEEIRREYERLVEKQRNQPIDWDAINRQQREQSTRMAVMLAFLDQRVPPEHSPD